MRWEELKAADIEKVMAVFAPYLNSKGVTGAYLDMIGVQGQVSLISCYFGRTIEIRTADDGTPLEISGPKLTLRKSNSRSGRFVKVKEEETNR